MKYKKKSVELLGTKDVFGKKIAWIKILEDGSFKEVSYEDLEEENVSFSLAYVRFIAIAAKIKDEVAKKKILAPYESSLIPLPHQIMVLEKVMQSTHNRFLLADEVGMGKTIETGLIFKELKIRGDIGRTLVIVPKSSMLQWQSELKEHFNEVFHIYDSEVISSLARTFANINADQEFNFWEQHHQIIVSTDALKPLERRQGWSQERVDEYNKYRIEAVMNANFDLVVIDEAHKVGGSTANVSRYLLAQGLCNTVPNVLLLSATPHRGKSDHFRRILQLLDPDAFAGEGLPEIHELEPYVIRTEKRLAVDYEGTKLFSERETGKLHVYLDPKKYSNQIDLYKAVTNYVRKGFNTAKRTKNNATGLIMILFQRLVSSSTAAILSAMEGRLQRIRNGEGNELEDYAEELDYSEIEDQDVFDLSGVYASDGEGLRDEETILSALIQQAKDCMVSETDAKLDAFVRKFQELKQDTQDQTLKVIIFTEFRTTQRMLLDNLNSKGYQCTMINGSQDIDQRKAALSKFKNEAQILIATDAAGESLNMQFCHIIFNYDLPWNPMMIEQRIGRIDRIGQKKKVKAFNMLTNNSVDLRVYEVIEEKLNSILHQLGIDKTSDVLDSTIDMKKVNKLYLQSLLDPSKFEFAGDKWLMEIRAKLKDYQSTEGILPEVKEAEIDYKKAAEVKHSPLPLWLEDLIKQFTEVNGGTFKKSPAGYFSIKAGDKNLKATFDTETSLSDPGVQHLTLQHDWVKKILNDLGEFASDQGIPVIAAKEEETTGTWSLWQISAQNQIERKVSYQCYFVADNGKLYAAYANDIWNRLVSDPGGFNYKGNLNEGHKDQKEVLEEHLLIAFQNLEAEVVAELKRRFENRQNSYQFQKSRVEKIGIENIRLAKLKKLDAEHKNWLNDYNSSKKVIPGIKHLLSIKIDGN